MDAKETRDERAIRLGHPSYVWRSGQDRRLAMIEEHAPLLGKRVLDVGCGLGAYVAKMAPRCKAAYGVDIDEQKIYGPGSAKSFAYELEWGSSSAATGTFYVRSGGERAEDKFYVAPPPDKCQNF